MRLRVSIVTIVFVFGVICEAAAQKERPAQSAECKEVTARLIEATNARFDTYSALGTGVYLTSPEMFEMTLSCGTPRHIGIALSRESGLPPNDWFTLLARAGAIVTLVDWRKLEAASRKCYRAALKAKYLVADLYIPQARINCQAFTRDGGADITISMSD